MITRQSLPKNPNSSRKPQADVFLLLKTQANLKLDKNVPVFGMHPHADQAQSAIGPSIAAGFVNTAISVLLPDTNSTKVFAQSKDTKISERVIVGVTACGAVPIGLPPSRKPPDGSNRSENGSCARRVVRPVSGQMRR